MNLKKIPSFPDYFITNDGRVYSSTRKNTIGILRQGRWLRQYKKKTGYFIVYLCVSGKRYTCQVGRLVLETYVGPCPERMECRHLNGNPSDNKLSNLCWGTHLENMQDQIQHGKSASPKGEKSGKSKLTDKQVRTIYYSYQKGTTTLLKLATAFNVSFSTIGLIVNKKIWRHLWI